MSARRRLLASLIGLVALSVSEIAARATPAGTEPVAHIYASPGGVELRAYVFSPQPGKSRRRAAIVVFHGGGWAMGEPAWAFARARHFADLGMVAVAAQYRLSDEKLITPIEAMADARAVIRWMRSEAASLGIDPDRIAAYGWSAGAHLAASAATFTDMPPTSSTRSDPDALILVSPAVSLESDRWAQQLLGRRATVREISPDEHVRKGLPATLILQGSDDTVTPLAGVKRYCDRLRAASNRCELHVYPGYGHLFTAAGMPDNGTPQPDPVVQADALARADRFLASLRFIKSPPR